VVPKFAGALHALIRRGPSPQYYPIWPLPPPIVSRWRCQECAAALCSNRAGMVRVEWVHSV
jgi:hypothetical protein